MYNLLMVANPEYWDSGSAKLEKSRFLEYTSDDIKNCHRSLDANSIALLKRLPTLFAFERQIDKPARLGSINNIATQNDSIAIRFDFYPGMVIDSSEIEKTFLR
jgi:hypothetical protein